MSIPNMYLPTNWLKPMSEALSTESGVYCFMPAHSQVLPAEQMLQETRSQSLSCSSVGPHCPTDVHWWIGKYWFPYLFLWGTSPEQFLSLRRFVNVVLWRAGCCFGENSLLWVSPNFIFGFIWHREVTVKEDTKPVTIVELSQFWFILILSMFM